MSEIPFPFDLLYAQFEFAGPDAALLSDTVPLCMTPPAPWGPPALADIYHRHCQFLAGDTAEFGVALGGTSFLLAGLGRDRRRKLHAFDSWEGLPALDTMRDNPYFRAGDYGPDEPQMNLYQFFLDQAMRLGLAEFVVPHRGWFKDTLAQIPSDARFCFVHIDGDLYQSTMDALQGIYDRVVDGGVIVFDDFLHPAQGPKRAACEFFNGRGLHPVYHMIFPAQAFVVKGEERTLDQSPRRAVDGTRYCFENMRASDALRLAVESSQGNADSPESARDAQLLKEFLGSQAHENDPYRYWMAMTRYWAEISEGFEPNQRNTLRV